MTDLPSYPGVPRWVKVSLAAVIILILAAAILMLLSGGRHGPQRHFAPADPNAAAPHGRDQIIAPPKSAGSSRPPAAHE